jgi:hypothetical protein
MKFILILFISALAVTSQLYAQSYDLWFVQDGQEIAATNGKVKLKRAPFRMQFVLKGPTDLRLNASFSSENLKAVKAGKAVSDMPCFGPGTGMADYALNQEKWIILEKDSHNFWYYESPESSSFDEVVQEGEYIHCFRTVERYLDPGHEEGRERQEVKLEGSRLKRIYLVIVDLAEENAGPPACVEIRLR